MILVKIDNLGQKGYFVNCAVRSVDQENGLLKGVHERKKPFCCIHCSASFSDKGKLNRHIRDVHKR